MANRPGRFLIQDEVADGTSDPAPIAIAAPKYNPDLKRSISFDIQYFPPNASIRLRP